MARQRGRKGEKRRKREKEKKQKQQIKNKKDTGKRKGKEGKGKREKGARGKGGRGKGHGARGKAQRRKAQGARQRKKDRQKERKKERKKERRAPLSGQLIKKTATISIITVPQIMYLDFFCVAQFVTISMNLSGSWHKGYSRHFLYLKYLSRLQKNHHFSSALSNDHTSISLPSAIRMPPKTKA